MSKTDFCPRCGCELRVASREGAEVYLICRNPQCAGYKAVRRDDNGERKEVTNT